MSRPSKQIDQALLASGAALFPGAGCGGLSVRAVAEHAGVNPAMFHYHFGSKDDFLRTLLQHMYEEMFASLAEPAQGDGPALERLRGTLRAMARFARAHRWVLARVWMDSIAGEPVAREFFARNAPRHLGVLFALLQQAHAEGALRELPPLQRFAFAAGSVLLPIMFVAGLAEAQSLPGLTASLFDAQVMSDAAIDQRIELALQALAAPVASSRGASKARMGRSAPQERRRGRQGVGA